jgi:cytochrome b561
MQLKNTTHTWGGITKSFHWVIALLIFVAIALGLIAHEMPTSPAKVKLFILHKSIGVTVFVLVVLRFLWKLFGAQPQAAKGITEKNEKLAHLGHWALYGFMFALPLTGWILNTAANFPFKWMNLFAFPDFPGIGGGWKYPAFYAHQYLAYALMIVVGGHACMAILHHVKHNSDVLTRMLPSIKPPVFAIIFLAVFGGLVFASLQSVKSSPVSSSEKEAVDTVSPSLTTPVVDSSSHTDKLWLIVADDSKLSFVGTYDDVPFDGEFKQFRADMYFDPSAPEQGFFDVQIDTGSITTYSDDWDGSLPDEEWFFIASYPQATYQASQFVKTENGYRADGVLSLKGISKPVSLEFSWLESENGIVDFSGEATVKRTDFNIGVGEWAEDDTIGFDVKVKVNLKLKSASNP